MPLWNAPQLQEMQVVRTICSSTAKTSTVILIFLHYFINNNASQSLSMTILWPAEKEAVSHTVRACKTRRNADLDAPRPLERVSVGYFLSHRTIKIPSSINKPVPGSTIVNKWSEKKHEILNHIFYCISYVEYHFNVCFSPVQTDAFLTVYVWCCGLVTGMFSFRHAIRFCPVERIAKRSLPHRKILDNMEHPVTSQLLEAAICFLRLQINLYLTSFF